MRYWNNSSKNAEKTTGSDAKPSNDAREMVSRKTFAGSILTLGIAFLGVSIAVLTIVVGISHRSADRDTQFDNLNTLVCFALNLGDKTPTQDPPAVVDFRVHNNCPTPIPPKVSP